jgi:hypothetical protein
MRNSSAGLFRWCRRATAESTQRVHYNIIIRIYHCAQYKDDADADADADADWMRPCHRFRVWYKFTIMCTTVIALYVGWTS